MKQIIFVIIGSIVLLICCTKDKDRFSLNGFSIGDVVNNEFQYKHDLKDATIFGYYKQDSSFAVQTWNDTIVWMIQTVSSQDEYEQYKKSITKFLNLQPIIKDMRSKERRIWDIEYLWIDSTYYDEIGLFVKLDSGDYDWSFIEVMNSAFVNSIIPEEPEIEMYDWEE